MKDTSEQNALGSEAQMEAVEDNSNNNEKLLKWLDEARFRFRTSIRMNVPDTAELNI